MGLWLPLTLEEFVAKRGAYSYPAVALNGCVDSWTEICFQSTSQMDNHHRDLLTSPDNVRTVMGYLSTIFWGHFSGQDGRTRAARAQAKAKHALNQIKNGRGGGIKGAADTIRRAHTLIESDRYGDAVKLLSSSLPQLGPVFASKVCAFLVPAKCGVIDSIIASKYPQFGFSVDGKGYVKGTATNMKHYDSYCAFLRERAQDLNRAGDGFLWRDRDNTSQRWRAVDVERAIF